MWWIVPKYSTLDTDFYKYGYCYFVEEQREFYARHKVPIKKDFETKEDAELWLNNYNEEDIEFKKSISEIKVLKSILDKIETKLYKHENPTENEISDVTTAYSNITLFNS